MDNLKNDTYYIEKVIENIDAIITYTEGISFEDFNNNELLVDATMFRLIQMAENIIHISKNFKEKNTNIQWGQVIGFRNGIVHDYGKTDYSIVYEIISSDIYDLKKELQNSILSTNK